MTIASRKINDVFFYNVEISAIINDVSTIALADTGNYEFRECVLCRKPRLTDCSCMWGRAKGGFFQIVQSNWHD